VNLLGDWLRDALNPRCATEVEPMQSDFTVDRLPGVRSQQHPK
jgi:hypothetical protein